MAGEGHLGLALVSLALCGCLAPERRIVATVRDPGAVSLHVVSWDGVNKEVLAGDGQPGSATAASGTFPTGGSSSASYELDADRLPDHTIRLRWAHPPIVGGEIDTILPPSGRIRLPGTDDVASTIRLDAPTLRVPYTAFITPSSDSDGDFNGYAASASAPQAVPAGASVAVATTLETPWSNVVEVRRRVTHQRSFASAYSFSTACSGESSAESTSRPRRPSAPARAVRRRSASSAGRRSPSAASSTSPCSLRCSLPTSTRSCTRRGENRSVDATWPRWGPDSPVSRTARVRVPARV